jgi:hypothetical protein
MKVVYVCDNVRHLVCTPYSIKNLHAMADALGISRSWFQHDHYDIPHKRVGLIMAQCREVRPRDIWRIIHEGKMKP